MNADGYLSTGQGVLSHNMFAYCLNNPVIYSDPSGYFVRALIGLVIVGAGLLFLGGCSSKNSNKPRKDLANSSNLDISKASKESYNCYGNGIQKQTKTDPTGYTKGDSTRKTFEAVKNDLGSQNVRELSSVNAQIGKDEFKVAMKCGPTDYHFIRCCGDKWYNKSGTASGVYVEQAIVEQDMWYAIWEENGQVYIGDPAYGFPYYDDETIYFAVKTGWDAS